MHAGRSTGVWQPDRAAAGLVKLLPLDCVACRLRKCLSRYMHKRPWDMQELKVCSIQQIDHRLQYTTIWCHLGVASHVHMHASCHSWHRASSMKVNSVCLESQLQLFHQNIDNKLISTMLHHRQAEQLLPSHHPCSVRRLQGVAGFLRGCSCLHTWYKLCMIAYQLCTWPWVEQP